MDATNWFTGQLLVAMPTMQDPRFAHSVVYLCSHAAVGSMGIVLNRVFAEVKFKDLLTQLSVSVTIQTPSLPVHFGGPVEAGRGFVLHSPEFVREGTMKTGDKASLTATVEILQAIADGKGPQKALLALGYAGWGAGQLEAEVQQGGWMIVPADETLLFDGELEKKWERSLSKIGVFPSQLSSDIGHA